jgi:hypothetical protein
MGCAPGVKSLVQHAAAAIVQMLTMDCGRICITLLVSAQTRRILPEPARTAGALLRGAESEANGNSR